MDLTNNHRALILKGLRSSSVSKTALAEKMGYGKAWVTKLLNGTLKSVSDSDALKLEEELDVRFVQFVDTRKKVSGLAMEIDELIEKNDQFAKVLHELIPLIQKDGPPPRYFDTKEMSPIGEEITRIVFANEGKPGKITREVLALLERGPGGRTKVDK